MKYADLVLKSNAIFTGIYKDVFRGGVAIAGNRIVAVGKESEIEAFIGNETKVYQFGDELIMPGFNDSHIHLPEASLFNDESYCLDLSGCHSEEECVGMVREFAAKHPENAWIFGRGWNHWIWDKPVMPSRLSLEKVNTIRPICLQSWDLHSAWVNQKALEICDINRNTPDLEGRTIERFGDGEPSGLLSEIEAVMLVTTPALRISDQKLKSSILEFLSKASKYGITSLGDLIPSAVAKENAYEIYQQLEDEGLLNTRIHFFSELKSDLNEAKVLKERYRSEKVRFCGLKQIVDGVVEAHTAYLVDPYTDDTKNNGAPLIPRQLLEEQIIHADKAGFSIRLHTIGDAAVRMCLDCYEVAQAKNGKKGLRHALEHLETIQDDDIKRLSKLGIIASMQPLHFIQNVDGYPVLVGEERVQRAWAIKSMIDSGAIYAFGSDAPVVDMNPLPAIFSAITRTTEEGHPVGGFVPKEKITMDETLRGYSFGSAYVENFEHELGTLEVGKLADIVVLSNNLFAIQETEILDTKVLLTIMDGRIIYEDWTAEH